MSEEKAKSAVEPPSLENVATLENLNFSKRYGGFVYMRLYALETHIDGDVETTIPGS